MERYLRENLLVPGPRLMKKEFYRAAVSKRLRNTGVDHCRKNVPTCCLATQLLLSKCRYSVWRSSCALLQTFSVRVEDEYEL